MKNVLHCISLGQVGGVEILFHELIKRFPLPTVKHSLALYTDGVHPFFRKTVSQKTVSVYSIKYFKFIKLPQKPLLLRRWNTSRILNLVMADMIIFWNSINHDDYIKSEELGRGSKFVFYDHGTSWYREKNKEKSKQFLSKMDLTLCCSYASKRVLELYHQHSGRMRVIYNPLRTGFFDDVTSVKTAPVNRPLRLGVAGRFVHIKGISLAIHAIAALKARGVEAELFVAGQGRFGQMYKKVARQLNIEKQVHFLGLVENMANFFNKIDIFVCPSIREPFGIVAVEAMGKGCPLICARVDGLAEVVTQEKTGISLSPTLPLSAYEQLGGGLNGLPEFVYNPDLDALERPKVIDPNSIADAVARIVSNPDDFRLMSKECIQDANRRFGFKSFLDQLSDALVGI